MVKMLGTDRGQQVQTVHTLSSTVETIIGIVPAQCIILFPEIEPKPVLSIYRYHQGSLPHRIC